MILNLERHYQHYHVGPGRVDVVRKWKDPKWRGPEGAAAWSHIYQTGDDDDGGFYGW